MRDEIDNVKLTNDDLEVLRVVVESWLASQRCENETKLAKMLRLEALALNLKLNAYLEPEKWGTAYRNYIESKEPT